VDPELGAQALAHGARGGQRRRSIPVERTVRVPAAVHGRAFAAYNAARNTAELGAVGAGGVLVSALGARAALLLAGLGPILAAVAGLTALRQRRGARRTFPWGIGPRSAEGKGSEPSVDLKAHNGFRDRRASCRAPRGRRGGLRALQSRH
jgi:hypothetical protein